MTRLPRKISHLNLDRRRCEMRSQRPRHERMLSIILLVFSTATAGITADLECGTLLVAEAGSARA
jgi:hypothetical protein